MLRLGVNPSSINNKILTTYGQHTFLLGTDGEQSECYRELPTSPNQP